MSRRVSPGATPTAQRSRLVLSVPRRATRSSPPAYPLQRRRLPLPVTPPVPEPLGRGVRCCRQPNRGRGSSPSAQPRLGHLCVLKPDAPPRRAARSIEQQGVQGSEASQSRPTAISASSTAAACHALVTAGLARLWRLPPCAALWPELPAPAPAAWHTMCSTV